MNWSEAIFYCRTLSLGGHADWRLPSIDELQGIYDQSAPAKTLVFAGRSFEYHIKGGIIPPVALQMRDHKNRPSYRGGLLISPSANTFISNRNSGSISSLIA